ncbi:DUF6869 domain-containing protein [Rhodovulum marinum]|uniref:DUF6869 domain-containing protein n=1 Tax=Rhodovulum marinum TaxID=320662 RepID=A0A4R2Q2S4_9RHOB|nr:hypothetical protein [Rhodovulum marinum]TCP42972.1 hypothetical protein EV662_102164 [Rhodovulum marinum]
MTDTIPGPLIARAMGRTDPAEDLALAGFAALYLEFLRATMEADDPAAHPLVWTYALFSELAEGAPALAFDAFLACLARCETAEEVAFLAAGPLEDLIAGNGAAVIGRIEAEAAENPRMRFALSGVWPPDGGPALLWARVRAARGSGPDIDRGDPLPA